MSLFCLMVLQVIQALPPALLELPLSLLSRLFLCDPERSGSHLGEAASGFFSSPQDGQLTASLCQAAPSTTASSLLYELLQLDALWDSAVELLTLMSHVARCTTRPARLRVHVEVSVLRQALTHPCDQIKAATCRFLGNLELFTPSIADDAQLDVFRLLIDRLNDSCAPVRRMACRAVGNWLGYIAAETGFKSGNSSKEKKTSKPVGSRVKAAGRLVTVAKQKVAKMESWRQEAKRTAAMLASLLSDPDAVTRRHCCAALGNLLNVDGAMSVLLDEDVPSFLLRTACSDSHNAVRRAAMAALGLYSQQDAVRQVTKRLFNYLD